MVVELISVGTELLLGNIVNTKRSIPGGEMCGAGIVLLLSDSGGRQ